MTNFEKLKALPSEKFWERISELTSNPLTEYIDVPAWLDSETEDVSCFVKSKGECLVKPSELEIILCSHSRNETEKDMYTMTHSKRMKVLEPYDESRPYAVVSDMKTVLKVHKSQITLL